jgi:hypothetical protein
MRRGLFFQIFVSYVFGGINPLLRLLVEPIITNDAVLVRVRTRQKRCVANPSISRGVTIMVVAVPCALVEEKFESARTVLIVVLEELVLGEAVDHHKKDKLRRRFAGGGLLGGNDR